MTEADPVERMARAIVLSLFPALDAAMMRGQFYRHAAEAVITANRREWSDRFGEAISDRAVAILRRLGSTTVMTPYGLALFMREYPVEAIPDLPPPEASGEAVPHRRPLSQLCDWLWRLRPASRA